MLCLCLQRQNPIDVLASSITMGVMMITNLSFFIFTRNSGNA